MRNWDYQTLTWVNQPNSNPNSRHKTSGLAITHINGDPVSEPTDLLLYIERATRNGWHIVGRTDHFVLLEYAADPAVRGASAPVPATVAHTRS